MDKQLALGVVAALLMAGGQANAQTACPTSPTVMSSVFGTTDASISSFSCTIGDKVFSDFSFPFRSSTFLSQLVDFGESGSDTTIAFMTSSTSGSGFGNALHTFDFAVAVAPTAVAAGTRIVTYTLDAAGGAALSTSSRTIGNNSGINATGPIMGTRSSVLDLSPGDTHDEVSISSTQGNPGNSRLNSITNTFTQSTPVSVPEPSSLSLFGLGLAGLALARRRRS